jgi:carboxyvinyl-carboxyphosphonate phosphorylmutase
MISTVRRERLRGILAAQDCVVPASVFDPLSMRAAEDLGFETALLAGSIASCTVLGAPDLVLLTLSELADQTRRICRAGDVPLIVDGDHGYGNALNVRRTVEELEAAGAAAVTIEDSVLPRAFGAGEAGRAGRAGKAGTVGGTTGMLQLVSIPEAVGKLRAALDARLDPSLVIVGRTNMAGLSSVEELMARLRGFEAAGVDALMIVGLQRLTDLDIVASAVGLPLILGGNGPDLTEPASLASRKVRLCFSGHQPFLAATRAVHDALRALRSATPASEMPRLASQELMTRLVHDAQWERRLTDFLF